MEACLEDLLRRDHRKGGASLLLIELSFQILEVLCVVHI